jgi:hypothetical protein
MCRRKASDSKHIFPSIKTSWKDTVIGGNLNIHGTEVALTKDFKVRPGLLLRIQG